MHKRNGDFVLMTISAWNSIIAIQSSLDRFTIVNAIMVLLELEEFGLKTEKIILTNETNASADLIDFKVDQ